MTYDELRTLKKDLSGLCDRLMKIRLYVDECESSGQEAVFDYTTRFRGFLIPKEYNYFPISEEFKCIREDLIALYDRVADYLSVTKNNIKSER